MADVVHHPKGTKLQASPDAVIIHVLSRGRESVSLGQKGRMELRILKMDADEIIQRFAKSTDIRTVNVIGYNEARDHYGKKRDELKAFLEGRARTKGI